MADFLMNYGGWRVRNSKIAPIQKHFLLRIDHRHSLATSTCNVDSSFLRSRAAMRKLFRSRLLAQEKGVMIGTEGVYICGSATETLHSDAEMV